MSTKPIKSLKGQLSIDALKINQSRTCDFQQCGILTSVDSDEPVQPPFEPRNSK